LGEAEKISIIFDWEQNNSDLRQIILYFISTLNTDAFYSPRQVESNGETISDRLIVKGFEGS
jgi:hypothetical protein